MGQQDDMPSRAGRMMLSRYVSVVLCLAHAHIVSFGLVHDYLLMLSERRFTWARQLRVRF